MILNGNNSFPSCFSIFSDHFPFSFHLNYFSYFFGTRSVVYSLRICFNNSVWHSKWKRGWSWNGCVGIKTFRWNGEVKKSVSIKTKFVVMFNESNQFECVIVCARLIMSNRQVKSKNWKWHSFTFGDFHAFEIWIGYRITWTWNFPLFFIFHTIIMLQALFLLHSKTVRREKMPFKPSSFKRFRVSFCVWKLFTKTK